MRGIEKNNRTEIWREQHTRDTYSEREKESGGI